MSLATVVVLGRNTLGTVISESTFNDVTLAHAAGDSFKFQKFEVTPNEERAPRRDIRNSRSEIEVMVRNRTNEWKCSLYLLPRGTTTPPDAGPLFTAAIGTQTIGGSNVTYTYAATPPSVSFIYTGGDPTPNAQIKVSGAPVDEMTINIAPGQEPMAEFSGPAAQVMRAGGTATISAGTTSATQTLGTNEAYRFDVGTILSIDTDVNQRVASRTLGSNQIVLASSITTLTNDVVRPYTPWSNSSTNMGGSPIAAWNGSASIAGTSYQILGAKISVKNNWLEHRHQFSQTAVDYSPMHQEVTGTLTFRATSANLPILMHAQNAPGAVAGAINPCVIAIVLGTTATGRVTIDLPQTELGFAPLNVPESEDGTFEIPFRALTTTTSGIENNNAITLTWD